MHAAFASRMQRKWARMSSYLIWLVVAAVMAVLEAVSVALITVWFVVGALAAFVAAFLGAGMAVQIVVFLVFSVASLVLLRPLALKHRDIGNYHEPTLVGKRAVVVERIDGQAHTGRVETPDHMTWAALSLDRTPIDVGTTVKVVDQESIKLVVEPA